MVSSNGSSVIVPLSSDDVTTTANVQDNQVYDALTSCLSSTTLQKTHYMITASVGYDNDQNLYDLSMGLGFQLLCQYADTEIHRKKDWILLISMNLF